MPSTLVRAPDGGYLLGGYSYSTGTFDRRSTNYGFMDFWVVRTDKDGNKLWEQSYGTSAWDDMTAAVALNDGGFLLGGYTYGADGSKTSPKYGSTDFWIIRIDAQGNILWDRSYGGASEDWLSAIVQTSDGGFLLAGSSMSAAGGTKTSTNYGPFDFWAVRIDAAGQQLWDRSYGGTEGDLVFSAKAAPDGGFVLAGNSYSPANGSKTSPAFGESDIWIVRIDVSGNQVWDRSFGGSGLETMGAIQSVSEGGFIIAASSGSPPGVGKTSPNYGGRDFWAIRLDADGNKLWERTAGGSDNDFARAVREGFDGGFLLAGESVSLGGGTKTSQNVYRFPGAPSTDYWLVQLDHAGSQLWEQTIGGTGEDSIAAIENDGQTGFVLLGSSDSAGTGMKSTANYGELDYWVVKVGGLNSDLRLEPTSMSSFRFVAEPEYMYVSERSSDLTHWSPFETNFYTHSPMTVIDPTASALGQFYRMRLGTARRAPRNLWRPLVATGAAKSSELFVVVRGAGEVLVDDVQLVLGTIPESGLNAVRGGDFESDLSAWTIPANYAGTQLTTETYRSGQSSLKLVSDGTSPSRTTVLRQYTLTIETNATYTLSVWYLPTTNSLQLTVRLSDNSIAATTNVLNQPLP
ncbi:MAG TPA: hypothetical protein VJ063_18550 [Verrucomicrobiae bacterium]|nr:hypothetical protein [Verrucomicrobiae bacterium]